MRFFVLLIAGMTLTAGRGFAEGEIQQVLSNQPISSGDIPSVIPPNSEGSMEIPPLLAVPSEPMVRSTNRSTCRTCANDYNPNYAYLPDSNPDCRNGQCGQRCRQPEVMWANADFITAFGSDIRDVKHGLMYGVKLGVGFWFNDENTTGLESSFLNIHDGYRDIFRGQFGPTLVDSPITLTTVDFNLRHQLVSHGRFRLDGLFGYRYLSLGEQLLEGTPIGSNFYKTQNSVNLAQFGVAGGYRFGPYTGELLVKLGFGRNEQVAEVNNVRTTDTVDAFVPELGLRVGYHIGEGAKLVFGYQLLYLDSAARPNNRDPNNYFLQGVTVGLEVRY